MKRKGKIYVFMLILIFVSTLMKLPASAEFGKDKYDIKISNIKVNSKNLKPGNKCKISMKIMNKGSEKLKQIWVVYAAPTGQYYNLRLKYNKSSQRWTGSFPVEKGMQKGMWRISRILVNTNPYEDGFVFSNSYYSGGGFPSSSSNLSKGNIRIRGSKGDYEKPEVHFDTLSVSKSALTDKGGKITYRLKVTDKSKIKFVRLTIYEEALDDILPLETEINMKYNRKTGYYEASIWKPKGTYMLGELDVSDVFGNRGEYFNSESEKYYPYRKAYEGRVDLSKCRVNL